jgi:hypothetical protein
MIQIIFYIILYKIWVVIVIKNLRKAVVAKVQVHLLSATVKAVVATKRKRIKFVKFVKLKR